MGVGEDAFPFACSLRMASRKGLVADGFTLLFSLDPTPGIPAFCGKGLFCLAAVFRTVDLDAGGRPFAGTLSLEAGEGADSASMAGRSFPSQS